MPYVEQVLCPTLVPGDVLILDNLSSHKVPGIRKQIEACGARLIYLPPYSPDLNPIETALVRQVCEGGFFRRNMYLATLV